MDSSDDEPYSPSDSVETLHSQSPSPADMSLPQEVKIDDLLRCKLEMMANHVVKEGYDETGAMRMTHYFSFYNHEKYPDGVLAELGRQLWSEGGFAESSGMEWPDTVKFVELPTVPGDEIVTRSSVRNTCDCCNASGLQILSRYSSSILNQTSDQSLPLDLTHKKRTREENITHDSPSVETIEIVNGTNHWQQYERGIGGMRTVTNENLQNTFKENISQDGSFIEAPEKNTWRQIQHETVSIGVPMNVDLQEDNATEENTTYEFPAIKAIEVPNNNDNWHQCQQVTVSTRAQISEDLQNYGVMVEDDTLDAPPIKILRMSDSNNSRQQHQQGTISPRATVSVDLQIDESVSENNAYDSPPVEGIEVTNRDKSAVILARDDIVFPRSSSESLCDFINTPWIQQIPPNFIKISNQALSPDSTVNNDSDPLTGFRATAIEGFQDDNATGENMMYDRSAIESFETPNVVTNDPHHYQQRTVGFQAPVNEDLQDDSSVEEMIINDSPPTDSIELPDMHNTLRPAQEDGNEFSLKRGLEMVSGLEKKPFKKRKLE